MTQQPGGRAQERVRHARPKKRVEVAAGRLLRLVVAQLVIGAEFLASHPRSYVSKAFEFTRAFFYRWTVNWKFV